MKRMSLLVLVIAGCLGYDVLGDVRHSENANAGGNISDLGGYYNELKVFTDCAKNNSEIKEASLTSAAASLKFLLEKEIGFDA